MTTEHFYDEQSTQSSTDAPQPDSHFAHSSTPSPLPPSADLQPRAASHGHSPRHADHRPRTLAQVISEANDMVVQGDLTEYIPIPTGFDPLDGLMGGGLRKTELLLLGGSQGIGKTIASLQIARNIAMRNQHYAFYLSYEHTEAHLMNRLLCLESINPPEVDLKNGMHLKDLYDVIISERAKSTLRRGTPGSDSLQGILRNNPQTALALARMTRYADRLVLVKASPAVTTLRAIREMTVRLCDATGGNLSVFVDYLQKVAIHPERASNEAEKVTIVVEGLKDIALTLGVPVWAVVAADREGLKSNRLHLYHLRGSSALDYECDIALIMNNKYHILPKDQISFNPYQARQYRNWVIFTIEKNRAGRAMQDAEFQLHAPYFAFNPCGQRVQQQLIDDKIIES